MAPRRRRPILTDVGAFLWRYRFRVALALFMVSSLALVFAASRRAHIAVVLALAAAVLLSSVVLDGQIRDPARSTKRRLVVGTSLMAVGIGTAALGVTAIRTAGLVLLGVSVALFGFGQLWLILEYTPWVRVRGAAVLVAAAVVAAFLGFVVFGTARPGWGLGALGAGAFAALLSYVLGSEELLSRLETRPLPRWHWVPLTAGGLATLLLPLFSDMSKDFAYSWVFGVVLFIFIGLLTSRTSVWLVAVVLTPIVVWSLLAEGRTPPARRSQVASTVVAFGDSYMSGEGAHQYYEGTNTARKNQCRRAPTAYAPTLAFPEDAQKTPRLFDDVVFLACSGAKAKDIYKEQQYPDEPPGSAPDPMRHQLKQYQELPDEVKRSVRLVIVSIGGNDASFGDIGKACAAPGNCAEIGEKWLSVLSSRVTSEVGEAYAALRKEFTTVPIVVMPYPSPLNEKRCDWSALTKDEHVFLHGFVGELDMILATQARKYGLHYVETVPDSFEKRGLRICDQDDPGEAGMNFFGLNPVAGVVEDGVNPQNWIHNSFHPNGAGHAALREVLVEWLAAHQNLQPAQPQPAVAPYQVRSLQAIMGGSGAVTCPAAPPGPAGCPYKHDPSDPTRMVINDGKWVMAEAVLLLRRHAWWVVLWLIVSSAVWLRAFLFWRKIGRSRLLALERRLYQRYG